MNPWLNHLTLLQFHSPAAGSAAKQPLLPQPHLPGSSLAASHKPFSHQQHRKVLQTRLWHLHGSRRRRIAAHRRPPFWSPGTQSLKSMQALLAWAKAVTGCDSPQPLHTAGDTDSSQALITHSKILSNVQYHFLFKTLSFRSCSSKQI